MYASFGKRVFDVVLALVAAVPIFLVCLLCVAAIRSKDGPSAIFRQTRVGRDQKPFVLYKLRTMLLSTGDHPSHEISQGQITRTGRFLRKTKLDELPQLINVIKGEMSFVGPRPCLLSQRELVEERQRQGVFSIRPGITGPGQLAGIDMSEPERLAEADASYLKQINLLDDVKCIIQTGFGRGGGDAVRRAD